jgi:hypothetical protein
VVSSKSRTQTHDFSPPKVSRSTCCSCSRVSLAVASATPCSTARALTIEGRADSRSTMPAAAGVGDEVDGVDVGEVLDDRAAAALGLTDGDVGGRPGDRDPDVGARDSISSACGVHQVGVADQAGAVPDGVLDQDRGDLLDLPLGPVAAARTRGVVEVHVRAGLGITRFGAARSRTSAE